MDQLDFSSLFTTKAQANDFLTRLSTVVDLMYTINFDLEKSLTETFGVHKKDLLMKLLRENNILPTAHAQVQEFLKKLKETIPVLPVVSLTIAFEPTDETLQKLAQWFLFTIKKNVLFDIQIDTTLIAGAKITYNGKFKDYSIKPTFDTLVQKVLTPKETQTPSVHQSAEQMVIGR